MATSGDDAASSLPPSPASRRLLGASSGRKRTRGEDEVAELVQRMSEQGLSTSVMAGILDVAEQDILNALVKRGRSEDGDVSAGSGASRAVNTEGGTASALMDRLLEDPHKLCCPVSHGLMEEPVVAEDGFTYEREVISAALAIKATSPTTNEPMGSKLVPNHILKSDIVEFKEGVVQEVILVAPNLPSGDAAKLLRRAEDFVRPRLPDAASREILVQILKLRAQLPAASRGSAVKDLAELIVGAADCDRSVELLDNFEKFAVGSQLQTLGTQVVEKLFDVAGNMDYAATIQVALGQEYAQRIVKADVDALAQRLWSIVSRLCKIDDGWTAPAAAVLARWGHEVQVDLTEIPTEVIECSVHCLTDPGFAQGTAKVCFGTELSAYDGSMKQRTKAKLFLELAGRQSDDIEACHLLVLGRKADRSNAGLRKRLIELLPGIATRGNQVDEALLITLFSEEGLPIPDELLSCLRLQIEELSSVPPEGLLAIAERLGVLGRGREGAILAIAVAKARKATGDHVAASKTYIVAYNMDASNLEASRGVVAMAGAVSERCDLLERDMEQLKESRAECMSRCTQLEMQCGQLKRELQAQVTTTSVIEWDVRSLPLGQEMHRSPTFMLPGGVSAHLRFFPDGNGIGKGSSCSAFLVVDKSASIDFTLMVDDYKWRDKKDFANNENYGKFQLGARKEQYHTVTCTVHKVSLTDGGLTRTFLQS